MNANLHEVPMRDRLLRVLTDMKPHAVKADVLSAQAGVRRMMIGPAMSQLIREGIAHLVGDDAYALGKQPLIERATASVAPVVAKMVPKETPPVAPTVEREKSCKRCGLTKPLTDFYRNPSYRDGYDCSCKRCRNTKLKAHGQQAPEDEPKAPTPPAVVDNKTPQVDTRVEISLNDQPAKVVGVSECKPRASLKCWQYTSDAEAMPMWLVRQMTIENGKFVFEADGNNDWTLEVGEWAVEFPGGTLGFFKPVEFSELFAATGWLR